MKIVKFDDGTYGIRRFSFFYMTYMYLDMKAFKFWWARTSGYFPDCRTTLEKAQYYYNIRKDAGIPI